MVNKVSDRCKLDKHAKFYYASNRMFFELKIIRIILYLLAVVPVVLTFIPQVTETQSLICSLISFALTLITEAATSFLNKHKEVAISSLQLYETGVTGSAFSKIEYDRELTNELNELAIRKGLPKLEKVEEYILIDLWLKIGLSGIAVSKQSINTTFLARLYDFWKGGFYGSVYFHPPRPDAGKVQGVLWADEAAARLLRRGGAHRRPGVLPDETLRQHQPRRHGDDRPHAPAVLPRHVREGRPAAGGGGAAFHPGEVHPPEGPPLCDQQLLLCPHAAGPSGKGGTGHCSKRGKTGAGKRSQPLSPQA